MSLVIFDNSRHHGTIAGSRIQPSGLTKYGTRIDEWACPRCGQHVDNNGGHLFRDAPCGDCREYLREECGDLTRYDRRRPPLPDPVVFETWPADVEISPLGYWLTVGGVDLVDLLMGEWAA